MLRGIYRMTARQFRTAIDAGVFGERHVELLGGIPFVMSENPPHILASIRMVAALGAVAAAPRWVVNKEHRLELGQWLPLPDAVVLRGPDTTYGMRWARADDVAFWLKSPIRRTPGTAAQTSTIRRFRIPVYWIVDLNRRSVESLTRSP